MPEKKQANKAGTTKKAKPVNTKKAKLAKRKPASTSKPTDEARRETYNKILNGLELQQVFVERELIERDIEQSPKKTSVHINKNNEVQIADDKHSFRIRDMLNIEGTNEGSDELLFTMDIILLLQYESKRVVTKAFMEQFVNNNLDLHSWPYFRELVQTATYRMNFPPLVLPLSLK